MILYQTLPQAFKYEIQKQTNTKQNMDVIIPNLAAFKFKIQTQENTNTKQLMDGSMAVKKAVSTRDYICSQYHSKPLTLWASKCKILHYVTFPPGPVTGKTDQSYTLNKFMNC